MTDLISRQAAIDAIVDLTIHDRKYIRECGEDEPDDWIGGINDAITAVEELPTIEPKKGKWIPKTLYPLSFSDGECKDCVQCSNCKTHWDFETNYCPNCGARMEQ